MPQKDTHGTLSLVFAASVLVLLGPVGAVLAIVAFAHASLTF